MQSFFTAHPFNALIFPILRGCVQSFFTANPFNALIFPILRGCVQSFFTFQGGGSDVVSVTCIGVRFSVMFHFMFAHYTFSSVWVAEWPPFGK